jgi:hypothetical protein
MEPCPNCGFPLGMRDLATGRCPRCDSVVTPILRTNPAPSEDAEDASGIWRGSSEPPLPSRFTPQPLGPDSAASFDRPYDYSPFEPFVAPPPPAVPPKPRRSRTLIILAALIAFTTVLVTTAIILAVSNNNPSATASPPATATANPATQTVGAAATAIISVGDTRTADPKSTATMKARTPIAHGTSGTSTPAPVTSTPQPTATQAPGDPPVLYVTPKQISKLACVNSTATFSVTNTGGGILEWAITHNDFNSITPQTSGSLSSGQAITLTVHNITALMSGGSIVIAATNTDGTTALDSPQSVTISCAL